MIDNIGNYEVELFDCSIKPVDIGQNKTINAVVADGNKGEIAIMPRDDQGSLGNFIIEDNAYFIVEHTGVFPDISFGHYIGGVQQENILTLKSLNSNFVSTLTFHPNSDAMQPDANKEIPSNLLGKDINGDADDMETRAIVCKHFTIREKKKAKSCIGFFLWTKFDVIALGVYEVPELAIGDEQTRMSLFLGHNTVVENIVFGKMELPYESIPIDEIVPMTLSDLKDANDDPILIENITEMEKLLANPDKTYNIEGAI